MPFRVALLGQVVAMAFDTLRTNKLRSGLTVLGVVIGITSIVGMTSMIRGFDQSLRGLIQQLGPDTIIISRFSFTNFVNGDEFTQLLKRPTLTISDARALEEQATLLQTVDVELGGGGPGSVQQRVFYRDQRTKPIIVFGTTEKFQDGTNIPFLGGRFFNGTEVQYRKNVVVLGNTAYKLLFEPIGVNPVGKMVRVGSERFEVVGVYDKRAAGGIGVNADDFVVIPYTAYQRIFGLRAVQIARNARFVPVQISVQPREGVTVAAAMAEVQRIMRSRHGLKLDDPDDFNMETQDAFLKLWDRISQATFLALVVISSIALMVGGIGVMAIMSITVTERTREIGVRRALGARRREVLFQFLTEAVVLTLVGGVLGIILGSAIGFGVHFITGFPVSLPLWSFALGLGFSASVGIFFGMYPAIRAARLDPIEALRHE
ncbi:MAG: ABC transporter permease [Vicinamibacterales bacterium]|nr:ABC transporter permease [Vicinamibacterales bacterium]